LGRISKWRFNGGLVEREEHSTAASQLDRTLAYDGFSQLKEFAWVQGSQRPYETSFLRDKMGRVVSANRQFAKSGHTSDKGWRGYKYQLSGALEVVFEGDNYAATGGLDPTDTTWAQVQAMAPAVPAARFEYSRDVEGSPLAVQRVDIAGQAPRFHAPPRDRGFQAEWVELDGAQKRTLKHDTAGRVTEEFGRTNTWDDFHSLITVEMHTARQAFQYDGLGRLVAARSGTSWDVEEEVAYDGMQMVAAWNQAGSLTWSAVWGQGIDNLVAVRPNSDGTEAFAMKDGRGSVVGYYHADGTTPGLVVTADYTPEGRMKSREWSTSTVCEETGLTQCGRLGGLPFGFHSAYKSPVHGLLYFRNRWYSAESGQWLSHDPLGEVDSANLYSFNGFDSINHRDPFGLEKVGLDSGGATMEVVKTSGFDEDKFEKLLYSLGAYDHLAKDEKGSGAGRRKMFDEVEGNTKVAQVTLSLGPAPAAPPNPILVAARVRIGVFGFGCGVIPQCRRNLAGIAYEGGRMVENGGNALDRKAKEIVRAIGDQISKMVGEDSEGADGPEQVSGPGTQSPDDAAPATEDEGPLLGDVEVADDEGVIYECEGCDTSSGKPYVGSTDKPKDRSKESADGRDRSKARVVDKYKKDPVRGERRDKEQQRMNERGGKDRLDNRRNERKESDWKNRGIKPPP
jgi:RHS repeat-associated protein